jgi:DNA-directed RNA polymerase specialized sigma54-like protein
MHLMASIIEEAQGRGRRITDEEIQGILKERHGIVVGRRAVNNWRREVSNRDEPQCP